MSWLEEKYLGLASFRLRNFKKRGGSTWSFSCPICNDSAKNSRKARGSAYYLDGDFLFHCHNCSVTMPVRVLLKRLDEQLYGDYNRERLFGGSGERLAPLAAVVEPTGPPADATALVAALTAVEDMPDGHPMREYVRGRLIPRRFWADIREAPRFFGLVDAVAPSDRPHKHDEPRLLIPFRDRSGRVHAFQGRSMRPDSAAKYVTVVSDPAVPKLYGLDRVDMRRPLAALEGPIDAMFLSNAVASAGGDIPSALRGLPEAMRRSVTVVYDNEPRSAFTVKKMLKAADMGFSVLVWPDSVASNDVNQLVLDTGASPADVERMIADNSRHGLAATLAINSWKKTDV